MLFRVLDTARANGYRTARVRSCDHLPNVGRVYIARGGKAAGRGEEGRSWRERATNVPLPVASASRGRVRHRASRAASPRRATVIGGDGARRAAPLAPPRNPAAPCRVALRQPLVYLSRRRTVHLFPFRSSPSVFPRGPVDPSRATTFSGGRKDGSLPRETRLITRSEPVTLRPRAQLRHGL